VNPLDPANVENTKIGATASSLDSKNPLDNVRIVLVTNGEQNSDIMSVYTHTVQFTSFKKSAAFNRVRADLHGVDVEMLYAPHGRWARTLDTSLQNFWQSYLLACGAASVRVQRL